MGIVWAIIITILGVLFALSLGFSFLTLAMVGYHSEHSARNSVALVLGESITTLLYASTIGVIITACWFPDLYLHYAKPHVWWFLGIFVVSIISGCMVSGITSKGIRGITDSIPSVQSRVIARILPIIALEVLMLVAFIMVWLAPLCIR